MRAALCPGAEVPHGRTEVTQNQNARAPGVRRSGVGPPGPSRVPRLTHCGKAGIESVPRKRFDARVRPARGTGNGVPHAEEATQGRITVRLTGRCDAQPFPRQLLFGDCIPAQWRWRGIRAIAARPLVRPALLAEQSRRKGPSRCSSTVTPDLLERAGRRGFREIGDRTDSLFRPDGGVKALDSTAESRAPSPPETSLQSH